MASVDRVVIEITYDEASQEPPSTWDWHLGIELPPGTARLAAVFGRTSRLGPALRDDLADARRTLAGMTERAVTAEAEVERLRGYITDALDSPDDPGMARDFLQRALGEGAS